MFQTARTRRAPLAQAGKKESETKLAKALMTDGAEARRERASRRVNLPKTSSEAHALDQDSDGPVGTELDEGTRGLG